MKYIKLYESSENKTQPQISDYIQINYPHLGQHETQHEKGVNFINNNIGKVVNIIMMGNEIHGITIKYDNIPPELENFFPSNHTKSYQIKYVIGFGKTPEEVKLQISANKYNL